MNKYQVLWIDDKHDTEAKSFKYLALNHGVELIAFKSLNKGINELENNYHLFDAVILDGNFLENENDPVGSEDLKNVREAIKRIDKLPKKFLPFILSGILNQEDNMSKLIADKVYDRRDEAAQLKLLYDLKEHVKNQSYFQIQQKYADVFSVSSDLYLGKGVIPRLFDLLSFAESDFYSIEASEYLNRVRKIIEMIFLSFVEKNFIPSELHLGKLSVNGVNKYLINNILNFKFSGHPHVIKNILEQILEFSNQGSHPKSIIEQHLESHGKYCFKGLIFSLCDIVIWYKSVVDNNLGTFKSEEFIEEGIIINKNKSGFAFLKCSHKNNAFIPPQLVSEYNLSNNDVINCLIKEVKEGIQVIKIFDVNNKNNAND